MLQFEEVKQALVDLEPELRELADALGLEKTKEEIEKLEQQAAAPGFWDDLENTQKVLQRTSSLKAKVENYNKHIESSGEDRAKNRLELRSKALMKTNKNVPELVYDWILKLNKSVCYFDKLQDRCNRELLKQWKLENKSIIKNISEFTRKYQDNIYTMSQLISLYRLLGLKNPQQAVYAFNKRNNIIFCF